MNGFRQLSLKQSMMGHFDFRDSPVKRRRNNGQSSFAATHPATNNFSKDDGLLGEVGQRMSKLAHLFVEMPVLQDLIGATGKLSQIYLKVDDRANTG